MFLILISDKENGHGPIHEEPVVRELRIPTEPYPITIRPLVKNMLTRKSQRSTSIEEEGK